MKSLMFFIMMCLAGITAMAQPQDTQVHIFNPNVKSLKIAPLSNFYFPPIYVMGSDDVLNVNFDYLDLDIQYLRYSVTHCDANWQPSQLVESEYIDGFNQADILDYKPSEATFVHYFNYDFCIPNNDFVITKSGNYLLKVYRQDDPDDVLFQTRFSVCENTMGIYAEVSTNTDVDYNAHNQQVNFVVTTRDGGRISDPYNELTAIVTQNSRPDREVIVTKPLMVSGNKVTFEHNRDLIFPAGNEYRRIDMVNVNSLNPGVEKIQYFEPYYHATLYTAQPRVDGQYLYDKTQYGRFTIRTSGAYDSMVEGDYIVTHFILNTGQKLEGGNLFVQGEFTLGMPPEQCLMRYDPNYGTYNCDILLKQGAYNYQFLWVPNGSGVGETSKIEGDKYQTCNEYLVKVYDRPFGERYDHFVGFGLIYSGR